MDGPRSQCDDCGRPFDFEDRSSPMAPRRYGDDYLCLDCKRVALCDDRGYEDLDAELDDPFFDDDDDLIDGVGFADPGGRSALRAATKNNPRTLPCPECGAPNRLTPLDVAQHYVCDECADMRERGY